MPIETGAKAPDFRLTDAEGNEHSLAEALTKGPVLLSIYKSSCGASKTAFPFLERLFQSYPHDRLTVWGVSQDSPNVTRSFMRRYGVTFPMLIEGDEYPVSNAYDIFATPTIFLIDSDGTVLWQAIGFQKPGIEELSAKIGELLGLAPADVLTGAEDAPAWVPG